MEETNLQDGKSQEEIQKVSTGNLNCFEGKIYEGVICLI